LQKEKETAIRSRKLDQTALEDGTGKKILKRLGRAGVAATCQPDRNIIVGPPSAKTFWDEAGLKISLKNKRMTFRKTSLPAEKTREDQEIRTAYV